VDAGAKLSWWAYNVFHVEHASVPQPAAALVAVCFLAQDAVAGCSTLVLDRVDA
jgi:hypothetical protein